MKKETKIQLFQKQNVRTHWDDEFEKWFFSIVDVVAILTDQHNYQTARKYWNKLKERLKKEENETVTNCHQLKMTAQDGKMRLTDILNAKDGDFFISDWLRNRNTIEFLGIWERIHNPDFNYGEYAIIRI